MVSVGGPLPAVAGEQSRGLLAVAQLGSQHRFADGELVADDREQREVSELLGARVDDRERRLGLAAGGEHAGAQQRQAGAQGPLLRSRERLLGELQRLGGIVAAVPEELGGRQGQVRRAGRPGPLPAVALGESDRVARLARRARVVVQRRGQQREVGDRDQDHPVVSCVARRAARPLEVALGAVELTRPQLGDAEIDERERAHVAVERARVELAAAQQRAPGVQRRLDVAAQAREVELERVQRDGEAPPAVVGHALGGRFGVRQQLRGLGVVAAIEQGARHGERDLGIVGRPRAGQVLDQRPEGADLAAQQQVDPPLPGQACRQVPRLGLDRVHQPAGVVAVLGQPHRGAPVELGPQRRRLAAQLGLQQLAEQRVVAIPLAAPVQRRQQHPAARELGQLPMAVVAAGERIRELARHHADDRRAEQEVALAARHARHDLRDEVVADRTVVAREVLDERPGVGMLAQ